MVVYEPFPTVPLNEFHPELRFEFKDIAPQMLDHYLLKTAVEMAERGNLVQRRVRIELDPGVTRYALHSPDGMRVYAILGARGGCCSGKTRRMFTPPEGSCCFEGVWYDPQEDVLHIQDCANGEMFVTIAVVPERDACELPKIFKTRYYSTLIMGTRANIMLITGQKWTNMRVGAELFNEYRRMLADDSIDVAAKSQRGVIKTQFGRVM